MEAPEKMIHWLREGTSFLITGHKGPDGDCLGSMTAFLELVRLMGGEGKLLLEKEPPSWFDFLPYLEEASIWEREKVLPRAEVLVLVDCHEFHRTGGVGPTLEKWEGRLLVIDHHRGRAVYPSIRDYVAWLDPDAAASALMVLQLYRTLEKVPPPRAADALLTGILTDTNWLQNSNTDSQVMEGLAYLSRECAPTLTTDRIYDLVFRRYPSGLARLMGKALSGAELHGPGKRLALVLLDRKSIEKAGFRQFESEILSKPLLSMEDVRAAAVLYELEPGKVKFSLRSKGGGEALALARSLGGGGHPEAAGAEMAGSLKKARRNLLEAWRALA